MYLLALLHKKSWLFVELLNLCIFLTSQLKIMILWFLLFFPCITKMFCWSCTSAQDFMITQQFAFQKCVLECVCMCAWYVCVYVLDYSLRLVASTILRLRWQRSFNHLKNAPTSPFLSFFKEKKSQGAIYTQQNKSKAQQREGQHWHFFAMWA